MWGTHDRTRLGPAQASSIGARITRSQWPRAARRAPRPKSARFPPRSPLASDRQIPPQTPRHSFDAWPALHRSHYRPAGDHRQLKLGDFRTGGRPGASRAPQQIGVGPAGRAVVVDGDVAVLVAFSRQGHGGAFRHGEDHAVIDGGAVAQDERRQRHTLIV